MTDPAPRNDSSAEREEKEAEKKPFSANDRWWWSGTFRAVIGAVIAYLQFGPISEGIANWMNWVMVGIGAAVAVWGIIDLVRDYDEHSKGSDN